MSFKKILIANRGEIAIRVIRTCRQMGITAAAVYSDADRKSLHVLLADEAYYIGKAPSRESYLNIDSILRAVSKSGADAVHPGYGFLSENASFARALKDNNITLIGPSPECIELMGDKMLAKKAIQSAGVPTVPGSTDVITDLDELKKVAKKIGYPIIIKASGGGGGKGMRVVHNEGDLKINYRSAKSEAKQYFLNDDVYVEKFVQSPKHIEIQVFGDQFKNAVHFFDRECSIQRRHQKIIEEAPSIAIDDHVRKKMGEVSVNAVKKIGYVGAGTFEFIFDNVTKEFFFMEMNTRLQVEHPVTEMITGFDLVKEQIKVAAGNKLSVEQKNIKMSGHAIEARVCAEDPNTFLPSPGLIKRCKLPSGPFIRVDTYAYADYKIPIYYDPMIGKLIVWGRTRDEAVNRMQMALAEFNVSGVKTNIVLLRSILKEKKFLDGTYTTEFLTKDFDKSKHLFHFVDDRAFLIAAVIESYESSKNRKLNNKPSRWKLSGREDAF